MVQTLMIKIIAIIVTILAIFTFGWFRGKKNEEIKQLQKENERQEEIIKKQQEVINKQSEIQTKDKEIIADIEKEAKQHRDKYNFGHWVIFLFILFLTSCAKPEIQTVSVCVKPQKLERPILHEVEIYPNMWLDNDTFTKIVENDIRLKGLIKRYENMIDIINRGIVE